MFYGHNASSLLGNYLINVYLWSNIIPMTDSGKKQDLWKVLVVENFNMLLVTIIIVSIS